MIIDRIEDNKIYVNNMWDCIIKCFGINPRDLTPKERGRIETEMFAMVATLSGYNHPSYCISHYKYRLESCGNCDYRFECREFDGYEDV